MGAWEPPSREKLAQNQMGDRDPGPHCRPSCRAVRSGGHTGGVTAQRQSLVTGTPSRQLGSMPMKSIPKRQMLSSQRGVPGSQEGKIPALGKLRKEQISKKETRALETKQDTHTRAPSRSGVGQDTNGPVG